jgi:hypothetical protein
MCRSHSAIMLNILIILLLLTVTGNARASGNSIVVGYSGVYLSGGKSSEANYPICSRNKVKLNKALKDVMERLSSINALPFNLIFETDAESRKWEIDNTYSLAIVITRDDVTSEKYESAGVRIYKTVVNVGMVVIVYQTGDDINGVKKNSILFSIPLVGYVQNLQGSKMLSETEIDEYFLSTATKNLEDHIAKRLSRISLEQIRGVVTDIDKDGARIDIGSADGLVDGQNIAFIKDNKKVATGRIVKLDKKTAMIKPQTTTTGFVPERDMQIAGVNMKGLSEETYQVVDFKVSSKKLAQIFPAENIGPYVAQWFSDFLVDRAGKVVLPSRIGGQWDASSTESAFMVLMKDGEEYRFEMSPPKYPITLDLTGVSSKMMSGNNVNEVWLYKVWMKVDISKKSYSKEFDAVATKNVVTGIQSYQVNDELYDLLYQISAKAASEGNL